MFSGYVTFDKVVTVAGGSRGVPRIPRNPLFVQVLKVYASKFARCIHIHPPPIQVEPPFSKS